MGKKAVVAPYSGAMLARVARSGHAQAREALARELDEVADDARLAQHTSERQDEVGRRRGRPEPSDELHAHDARHRREVLAPEHDGLGLNPRRRPR